MNELKITLRKPSALKDYENNPRLNDNAVEAVVESIREFGFRNPILIDEHDVIIAGHTRKKAAEILGLEKVPTIKLYDLSEEQVAALRLADNKTGELSEWDYEKLDEEIDGLRGLLDMTRFGFSINEDSEPEPEEPENEHRGEIKCPRCGKWQKIIK